MLGVLIIHKKIILIYSDKNEFFIGTFSELWFFYEVLFGEGCGTGEGDD
jgi:hypothetical protein